MELIPSHYPLYIDNIMKNGLTLLFFLFYIGGFFGMDKLLNVLFGANIDTSENWKTINPVIPDGVLVFESDTRRYRIGNGIDHYNDIPDFVQPKNEISGILETENPIIPKMVEMFESDTGMSKLGDGVSHWNDLYYRQEKNIYDLAVDNGYTGSVSDFWKNIINPNHLTTNSWDISINDDQLIYIIEGSKSNDAYLYICHVEDKVLIPEIDYLIDNSTIVLATQYTPGYTVYVREFVTTSDNTNVITEPDPLLGSLLILPSPSINKDGYLLADGRVYQRREYPEYYKYFGYLTAQTTTKVLFPKMTSNTTPAGFIVTASSYGTASQAPWNCFSGGAASWVSDTGQSQWVGISGSVDRFYKIKTYKFTTREPAAGSIHYPKTWTLQACETVNGSVWETIDSKSGMVMNYDTEYSFDILDWEKKKFYAKFRLFVTESSTGKAVSLKKFTFIGSDALDYDENQSFTIPNIPSDIPGFYNYIRVTEPRTVPSLGMSNYEMALMTGQFHGTEDEYVEFVRGKDAYELSGFVGSKEEWLTSFQDLYSRALSGGFSGTEEMFNQQLAQLGSNANIPSLTTNKLLIKKIDIESNIGKSIPFNINPNKKSRYIIETDGLAVGATPTGVVTIVLNDYNPTIIKRVLKTLTATTAGAVVTSYSAGDNSSIALAHFMNGLQLTAKTTLEYTPGLPIFIKHEIYFNKDDIAVSLVTYISQTTITLDKIAIKISDFMYSSMTGEISVYEETNTTAVNMHSYKEVYSRDNLDGIIDIPLPISEKPTNNFVVESETIGMNQVIIDDENKFILNRTKSEIQIMNYGLSIDGVMQNITNYKKPDEIIIRNGSDDINYSKFLRISSDIDSHSISINPDLINGMDVSLSSGVLNIDPGNIEFDNKLYFSPKSISKKLIDLFDSKLEVMTNHDIFIYCYPNINLELEFVALHSEPNLDRFGNIYQNETEVPMSLGKYYQNKYHLYRAIAKLVYVNDEFIVAVPSYRNYSPLDIEYNFNVSVNKAPNIFDNSDNINFTTPKQLWDVLSGTDIKFWTFTSIENQTEFAIDTTSTDEEHHFIVVINNTKILTPVQDYQMVDNKLILSLPCVSGDKVDVRCITNGVVVDSPSKQVSVANKVYMYTTFQGAL